MSLQISSTLSHASDWPTGDARDLSLPSAHGDIIVWATDSSSYVSLLNTTYTITTADISLESSLTAVHIMSTVPATDLDDPTHGHASFGGGSRGGGSSSSSGNRGSGSGYRGSGYVPYHSYGSGASVRASVGLVSAAVVVALVV